MLRSFMIISGRSGIVLFRKVFTKSAGPSRMIAGLMTALCEFSSNAIALPISYMELDEVAITVVEHSSEASTTDTLRCVAFTDLDDGELYGRLLATCVLEAFTEEHGERLATLSLANIEDAEERFKGFSSQVRFAIESAIPPIMEALEREPGVQEAMLFRHKRTPFAASFGDVWYAGIRRDARRILADLQALTHVSDDMLGTRGDTTSSLALGNRVAVERLSIATLVVVASPMETTSSCRPVIDIAVSILSRGV